MCTGQLTKIALVTKKKLGFSLKMSKDHDHEFNIILLGESGVGKTSLTVRYTVGTFKVQNVRTVIVNSFSKIIIMKGKKCKLSIWDTSGQEIYKSFVRDYYKNVDGVLLVYDITNVTTFNQLSSWLKEIRQISGGATTLIVGSKADHSSCSCVSRTMIQKFANDENLDFLESSAKTGENVDKIFEYLTLKILQNKQILSSDVSLFVSRFISLDTPREEVLETSAIKSEQIEQGTNAEMSTSIQQQSNSTKTAKTNYIPVTSNTSQETPMKDYISPNQNISKTDFSEEVPETPLTKLKQTELDLKMPSPNQQQTKTTEKQAEINYNSISTNTFHTANKTFTSKHISQSQNILKTAFNNKKLFVKETPSISHKIMNKDIEQKINIVLAGGPAVGKYCLALRYTTGKFSARGMVTVGANYFPKTIIMNDIKLNLIIWVLAGHEKYIPCVRNFIAIADGAILVYDVTEENTFNQLCTWLKEIKEVSGGATGLIVGNKIDHPNHSRISRTMVEQFARDEHMEFMECSAKTGQNVNKIFEYLALRILQKKQILPPEREANTAL